MEELLKELSEKIQKMETELDALKNERMALTAENAGQLVKFEYARFKRYYRGEPDFHKFVQKACPKPSSLSLFDSWEYDRVCFNKIVTEAIDEITDKRTNKFEEMTYAEKCKLRKAVEKRTEDFYKKFIVATRKA